MNSENPKRGEVWRVNFDPTIGTEIKKTRPAVVISSDAIGKLPIKLVAPITDWKNYFENNLWHVKIEPNPKNGLSKISLLTHCSFEEWIFKDSLKNSVKLTKEF